jgi:alpha-galactosidase
MEFLNNARNENKYPNDPLAPACYSPGYLFATVMFGNPLGFFECSQLPEDYIASVSGLVQIWKRERPRLFSGSIIPIGEVPDGVSWTGFAALSHDRRSGYVLLFRERNEQSTWTAALPLFGAGPLRLTKLAGAGTAQFDRQQLTVTIPKAQDFLWLKVDSGD